MRLPGFPEIHTFYNQLIITIIITYFIFFVLQEGIIINVK